MTPHATTSLSQPSAGVTLIELLIVIAILGILLALGMVNYARWRASSAVMQGAQEFAQAVRTTRSGAKRANACWQIAPVSFTASNTEYHVREYSGPTCPATAATLLRTRTFSMPPGTLLVRVSAAGTVSTTPSTINFVPPYGSTDGAADTFRVQWASDPSISRTVRVTGVFGKVILR
ncbi:Tfp pilus assembly protein FimT/FimU [uncultured Deinococcus sp.]|uniref:pilus assembly FimT family protein n=1 Tax=uncultured Deinococcus sp. TaxID=158789 RepID=UPI0025F33FCC|nr:prepilin-type N-terminal cleavage/methylation domain-containing protein [uncultured Deinococcus sp.]